MLELEVLKVAAHEPRDDRRDPRHGLPDPPPADGAANRPPRAHRARAADRVDVPRDRSNPRARASSCIERALEIGADPNDPYVARRARGRAAARTRTSAATSSRRPTMFEDARSRCSAGRRATTGSARRRGCSSCSRCASSATTSRCARSTSEYLTDAASARRSLPRVDDAARVRVDVARRGRRAAARSASSSARPGSPPAERLPRPALPRAVAWGEIGLYAASLDRRARSSTIGSRSCTARCSRRVASIRVADDYLRGRLSLAGHRAADEAPRAAQRLAREKNTMANVWGACCTPASPPSSRGTRAAELFTRAAMRPSAPACARRRPLPAGEPRR